MQVEYNAPLAYLAADEVGSKFICPHWHLQRLVVLCWDINVSHEDAAQGHHVKTTFQVMQKSCAMPFSDHRAKDMIGIPMTEGEVLIQGLCEIEAQSFKYFRLQSHCRAKHRQIHEEADSL